MSIFNQVPISNQYVKVRWKEQYVSEGINKKFFGIHPKGVYAGFVIGPGGLGYRDILVGPGSVSGGLGTGMSGGYVSGNYDESIGFNIAVHQNNNGYSSTVNIPYPYNTFHLDATGLDGMRVYIALNVSYLLGSSTTCQLMLVNALQLDQDPSLIVLGHVDVPASVITPLDASMFGYDDPSYPRLTPLSTPQRAGLMPAHAWSLIGQDVLPWTEVLLAERDPNNYKVVQILPSQKVVSSRRVYTYIQSSITSRFPRNNSQEYNGGVSNDQLTKLNLGTGVISGAHQLSGNLSFTTPSIVGTPNKFQVGIISIAPADTIDVTYGTAYNSYADATKDANLPSVTSLNFQVCAFVASTDGTGTLSNLGIADILDRRHFLNLGGGGGGLSIYDEGTLVDIAATQSNLIGKGVLATSTAPNNVQIKIPGDLYDFSDMLMHLEQLEDSSATITKLPNQIFDTFKTNKGIKIGTAAQNGQLVYVSGVGTYERTRLVNSTQTHVAAAIRAKLQFLAPKTTAISPSNTATTGTFEFSKDITDLLPLSKDVILGHLFDSDGEPQIQMLRKSTIYGDEVVRFSVVDATYVSGGDKTTVSLINPDAYDLSLGVSGVNFPEELVMIPYDYKADMKSATSGSYQSDGVVFPKGLPLRDVMALNEIGLTAESVLNLFTDAGLPGSITRLVGAKSASGQYVLLAAIMNEVGNSFVHFIYSTQYGNPGTFVLHATTKTTNTSESDQIGQEEHNGNFDHLHPKCLKVADNGKAVVLYPYLATYYKVRGVYTDLSVGSPTITDTPATGVDGFNSDGASAGYIFSLPGSLLNFFATLDGDPTDLGWIGVWGTATNDNSNIRIFSGGGSTHVGLGSSGAITASSRYLHTVHVLGISPSRRVFVAMRKPSTGNLQYAYWDEGSLATAGSGNIDATDNFHIIDSTLKNNRLTVCYNNISSANIKVSTSLINGSPSFTASSFGLGLGTNLHYNGWRVSAPETNMYKTVGARSIQNPSDEKHLIFCSEVNHPDSVIRATKYEVKDVTNFVGSQILNTTAGSDKPLRSASTNEQMAQTVTFSGEKSATLVVTLRQIGVIPAGNTIWCEIQETTAGAPNGTVVTTSNTLDPSKLTTSGSYQRAFFNFSPKYTHGSAVYAYVFKGTYPISGTNYVSFLYSGANPYASGSVYNYNGSIWSAAASDDIYFNVIGEWITDIGGDAASSSDLPFKILLEEQETQCANIDSTTFLTSTRPTKVQTANYRSYSGHPFIRVGTWNNGTGISTLADPVCGAYAPADFDKYLIFSTAIGTDDCSSLNVETGAISATLKYEDRSGLSADVGTTVAPTIVSDSNFYHGVAGSFNGTSTSIGYAIDGLTAYDFNILRDYCIDVEMHPVAVVGTRNMVSHGYQFHTDASGYLKFYDGTSKNIVASDKVEPLTYHWVRFYYNSAAGTGHLLRNETSQPNSTTFDADFIEVASYSVYETLGSTAAGTGLFIGSITGSSQFFSGKIGVVKIGLSLFNYSGFKNQAAIVSTFNMGRFLIGKQTIGAMGDTLGVPFERIAVMNRNVAENAVRDSNTLYLMFHDELAVENQGREMNLKITMTKTTRNRSGLDAVVVRGLKPT